MADKATFSTANLADYLSENVVIETKDGKISKRQADEIVKTIFTKMFNEAVNGADVKIGNFGTIKRVLRQSRQSKNPQTKEEITIPARYAIKLSTGKAVKDMLLEIPIVE